jgi:2-haloacid dehalogenase
LQWENPLARIAEKSHAGGAQRSFPIRALAFDLGHTLIDERLEIGLRLMPGVAEILPHLTLPKAVWANTRELNATGIADLLQQAGIRRFFGPIVTSVDAGHRKPAREFFEYAMSQWHFSASETLFVCNQLNTDVQGANLCGIRTAWLSSSQHCSPDETLTLSDVRPTFVISTLAELPALLAR